MASKPRNYSGEAMLQNEFSRFPPLFLLSLEEKIEIPKIAGTRHSY